MKNDDYCIQGKNGYYYPQLAKLLKTLSKSLKGKTVFYPGSNEDYTLNKALKKSRIINNDNNDLSEDFIKKYNAVIGDCRDLFKKIDYEVLYLNDVHGITKNLVDKTKEMVITCTEGHHQHKELLKSWKLTGILNIKDGKIILETDSLEDYETFPSDEEIRQTELYQHCYETSLIYFKNKKEVSGSLLKELYDDIVLNDYAKINRISLLDEFFNEVNQEIIKPIIENITDKIEDLEFILEISDLRTDDAVKYIYEINNIKSLDEKELINKADAEAIKHYRNDGAGRGYKKTGLLYLYSRP